MNVGIYRKMDITDISKLASRKRMNIDAEKLREKVSRETAKIIKLKVAQDTAYWDLKEKLQQVEGAHERLQQNMVDVQMQHEAVSAQYHEERRLRPDTLNKVQSTRNICDVLEEYGARLQSSVERCRADRAALAAAYSQCGARVRGLAAAAGTARASDAQRRVVERRLRTVLQQLGAERARSTEHETARADLSARLERAITDSQRKDEMAAAMRNDITRLVREFEVHNAEMKQVMANKEKELTTVTAEVAALRSAANVSRAAVEQTKDELGQVRAILAGRETELRQTLLQLQGAETTIGNMKKEEAVQADNIKKLQKVIAEKNQHELETKAEISTLQQYASKLEVEKSEVLEQLKQAQASCNAQASALEQAARDAELLRERLAAADAAFESLREANAQKIEELNAAQAIKDQELAANSATIARLMADLKSETENRGRADTALANAKRTFDTERAAAVARESALADTASRLEVAARAKDDELRAQMTIILDLRAEKDRLQEKIEGMQNTIDNIQKELTGRLQVLKPTDRVGEPPELDAGPKLKEPRRPDDNTLYNFLSDDGSVDGETLDPREVSRRFAALARGGLQPAPRRARAEDSISLSQVKDDLKMKNRTFFKNKRFDNKLKKFK